jgi:UDP-glucose 4-epimerase
MHFAAFAYVGESVTDPAKYYRNNLTGTLNLLDAMRSVGCSKLIFSSTCATYGVPAELPISEQCPQNPINPYGHSKLMVERVLKDYAAAYNLKSVIFRYFNAAGADEQGRIGEYHSPETHAVPLVIKAAMGRARFKVFGKDYPTADGTCIRDYIHVSDIATAHVLGLKQLENGAESDIFNIGNGQGYSVLQLIEAVEKVSGKKVQYDLEQRRAGDPPMLVASAGKIRRVLGWEPRYPKIEDIVSTAWSWHAGAGAKYSNW